MTPDHYVDDRNDGATLCPKCSTPLRRHERDGLAAFVCGACLGVWMPRDEIERTVRALAAERGAALDAVRLLAGPPQPTAMCCPICTETRLEWLTLRGVRVERCPQCLGIFVEPGEAETITNRVLLARRARETAAQDWSHIYEYIRQFARLRREDG